MISAWWLLVAIPVAGSIGVVLMAALAAGRRADDIARTVIAEQRARAEADRRVRGMVADAAKRIMGDKRVVSDLPAHDLVRRNIIEQHIQSGAVFIVPGPKKAA